MDTDELKGVAYNSFLAYMRLFAPSPNYKFGVHTLAIIRELSRATAAVEAGGTYYGIICVPPRHGKSDAVSRRYPVWHMGRNPNHDIILTSYSGDLTTDLAKAARRNARDAGPWLFGRTVDANNARWHSWGFQRGTGRMKSVGLGGAITGTGAHILIIDDYCRNREEAESIVMREKNWDSFRNDLWTRLAPSHAVIICATRWHEDDLIGRIQMQADKDPDFPKFKMIRFPAQNDKGEFLFPERFSPAYYMSCKSAVGSYAWQALYQQNPTPRLGNMFVTSGIQIVDEIENAEDLHWVRGWDLASSAAERTKDDPDYTVGTLAAFDQAEGVLYISDVVRGQWEAPERNRRIVQTAQVDGGNVIVDIEVVAGYKDTYTTVEAILAGKSVVNPIHVSRDKVARSAYLEPLFEAGKVIIKRGEWNSEWIAEFAAFPSGRHDDQVDSLVAGTKETVESGGVSFGSI